ncbi:MAG: Ribose-phosphate pyrophosphokinase [Candidatus Bipolaricaulis sibiricus]|uniref:ribose-phosphate diphosphokinase n=1 Tax=Bipolaricaulis sibiricus TaxID=2501609 RepID=A0A410FWK3_BIPS1|nr:MAG: Ribose-phosphate pyrophosphokinase [Candidatus Bipolaricaulis sibiricus]
MTEQRGLDDVRILSGTANLPLARRIAEILGVRLCEADAPSEGGLCYGPGRFPDGEVRVQIQQTVRGKDVFVIQPTSPPVNDHLMELLVLVDALRRASCREICAVIPYLGYARQDRKMTGRVPISARLVAELLETAGVNRVLTMDLHAGQIQGFFKVPLDHLRPDRMMAKYISDHHPEWLDNLTVASPDVGGVWRARRMAKRLGELVQAGGELPLAVVVMQRDEERKRVVVKDVIGRVSGRDVLLVDDILSSGKTLVTAAKEVMRSGAKRVFAACTHGVFAGDALRVLNTRWLQRVLVTDTIAHRDAVRKAPQIEIVSVAEFFADAIRRINRHESLTDLLAYMPV